MSEHQKKVLQMLADGKINVDEAQRLLTLVDSAGEKEKQSGGAISKSKSPARYIRIIVDPKPGIVQNDDKREHHGKVNVRVPLSLIRAGIKFASLIPSDTASHIDNAMKEKGFSFDIKHIKEEDLQELMSALEDSVIDVDNEYETVRVYAE